MSDAVSLNPAQASAVAHTDGPLLVFAGAGSGKTRVITYRIAHLVMGVRVPPYRILAVTFTNKAAREMRERLSHMLGEELVRDLWVGTFHAVCAKLLRSYGEAIGVPRNFVIYDSSDQKSLVARAVRDLGIDDKRYPPKALLSRIHQEKQEGRGPDDMDQRRPDDRVVAKVYEAYEAALAAAGALDFEDLIARTLKLARSPDGEELRNKFRYVLVDEFQDTNATQYALVRELVRPTTNLCVVGDDDQSIYSWRGADVRNIRNFDEDFPNANVVKLEQNYRSTGHIVKAALGVVSRSSTRVPKELWTAQEDGLPIRIHPASDERDEASRIVSAVVNGRNNGRSLGEFAVLYRIHAQSRVLEEALRQEGIPYAIFGGMKFFERAEIKDAVAYLRVLVNPRSDVDLIRCFSAPPRGIGDTTVTQLADHARALGCSMYEAMARIDEEVPFVPVTPFDMPPGKPMRGAAKKKLQNLYQLFEELRAQSEVTPPDEMLQEVLDRSGYAELLRNDTSAEAEGRLENLAELVGSIRDYADTERAAGGTPDILGFLERAALVSDTDSNESTDKLTLMTVHSAKGLEFDTVFIPGFEEDLFPYRRMNDRAPIDSDDLDEERRLAYVAITRARKELHLLHTDRRSIFGNTRYPGVSRFLADIPKEITAGARARASMPARPPQPVQAPRREGRYIDTSEFSDLSVEDAFRPGTTVFHPRFGKGEVVRMVASVEPAVLAFFPGWGEMKVLARFVSLEAP